MIEARIQPGKSLKEKNEDWLMLRKKAQAQLREALADAKNIAESAHTVFKQRALTQDSTPDWEGAGKVEQPKPYEGVLGFAVSGEGKNKEAYYEGETIYDEEYEKENLRKGKLLKEKAQKRAEENKQKRLDRLEKKKTNKEKKNE